MLLKSLFSRKKSIDAGPKLRRLMDLTMPNRPVCNDNRGDNRYNRTIPALMCPWMDQKPVVNEASFGISQDFSDNGLRVILFHPPLCDRYLVSFLLKPDDTPEYFHFISEIRDVRTFAGEMKSVGLLVTELADDNLLSAVSRATIESQLLEQLSDEQ